MLSPPDRLSALRHCLSLLSVSVLLTMADPADAGTLDVVRERGYLKCGVTESGSGLSSVEDSGEWIGMFPDVCRAIAAAVLGDKKHLEFIALSSANRFDGIRDGAADLLSETSTWTLARDTGMELTFAGLTLFDGQGFMVHNTAGAHNLADLRGASICVQAATTTIGNLRDYDRVHRLNFQVIEFQTTEGAYDAFFNRQCLAITDDASALASVRMSQAPNPKTYAILPEVISKEPLGPVVRDDDPQWADLVRWVLLALVAAEERDITAADAVRMRQSGDAEARRLLGSEGNLARFLKLDDEWALRAVQAVGNYGELFDRHLGRNSPLNLDRGPNKLWTHGGLLWAPPVR